MIAFEYLVTLALAAAIFAPLAVFGVLGWLEERRRRRLAEIRRRAATPCPVPRCDGYRPGGWCPSWDVAPSSSDASRPTSPATPSASSAKLVLGIAVAALALVGAYHLARRGLR